MARRRTILAIAASTSLLLMACGSRYDTAPVATSVPADCAANNLATLSTGKLTIGTDSPAYGPWFNNVFITAAELDNGIVVGQFANATAGGEKFGLVLSKGSSLTTCVSKAVDALRADGTLARIQEQWLAQVGVAPVLN
jgi:hypothetical protein